MPGKIRDIDELQYLMEKLYWIEVSLEMLGQWEGYLEAGEKYRDSLFKISRDSQRHRSMVKKLCSNIDGLNVARITEEREETGFDFKGKKDEEIIFDIMKHERTAHDMYTRLRDLTDRDLIKERWLEEDPEDYFKQLDMLIKEEEGHIALIKPFLGGMESIDF